MELVTSDDEIKHNIISLKLSNEGARGQIQEFLSLFPLNEFINLRSLSLIYLKEKNIEQLNRMLPLLCNLYYFSFTDDLKYKTRVILSALSKSKLRILSIAEFPYDIFIFKKISITSLRIFSCRLDELCELFQYASMLKYLKIEHLFKLYRRDPSNFPIDKAIYLKELIVDYSKANFEMLELLLKRIPNLTIFTICSLERIDMMNANRWQHLIESSLSYLRVFNFKFYFNDRYCYDDTMNKVQQFQTKFWCKQHHWYTNYEISYKSASIYTMPYVWNQYSLSPNIDRYDHSNEFDNVTNLTLLRMKIKDNSTYYFKNVKSLTLRDKYDYYYLQIRLIKSLNRIVNLSNIKHLGLINEYNMDLSTPSSLLELLKELPYVSSLESNKYYLKSFYNNLELCEHLNRKINRLYIFGDSIYWCIKSVELDMIFKIFSNVEQLYCHIEKLDDLLSILRQCSKLLLINLSLINKNIYSWYKMNASKLNVYIDFKEIDYRVE
ncbi:unnamed protein product [Rotaria sp. Silwood1]|nr:unnamed protein product [Rotaria sp. Silwood1]